MNKLAEVITSILCGIMPQNVVNALIATLDAKTIKNAIIDSNMDVLMTVPGIGPKRAQLVIKALRPIVYNVRRSVKVDVRDKAKGFNVRTFSSTELFRDVIAEIEALKKYRYSKDEQPEVKAEMVTRMRKLVETMKKPEPFTVRRVEGRVTRLSRFAIADVFGVDYETKRPVNDFVVLEHEVQEVLRFDWHLFASEKKEGEKLLDEFQQTVMERIGFYGLRVMERDNTYMLYGGLAASASHQKKEKLLMGRSDLLKKHDRFLWFGKTMGEYIRTRAITGAEYWKMRANEIRPIMKAFTDANDQTLTIRDVLFVDDVKKVYQFLNARIFGEKSGRTCRDGQKAEEIILGDGAILALVNLLFQGQATAPGLKGMVVNSYDALVEACRKHGITVEELYDMTVKGSDGKMHRIGDYKLVCGIGCWKFDKAFDSVDEYVEWLTEMGKMYPGVDNICLLRQAEEIEGEEKIRTLTRTLIQQWMFMTAKEQRILTSKARSYLRKQKTFTGAVTKLAALWKNDEERAPIEQLFKAAPWLVMNPVIQMYLEERWNVNKTIAMSGKFRTEGQYPYIMQDPVALYEVWLFGCSPDDPTIGVLRGDEVSVADVVDGKELACVRFPANFLTAKVMKNRSYTDVYGSCNAVAIISVFSDILVRQDGDVDGDEMCILYSRLAVRMTKRMNATFNPPVVLFEHGSKAERRVLGNYATFNKEAYLGLWRAKRYDSVGIYANLATACAYLASIAYAEGNTESVNTYLRYMSAASTGAILAIDQVKGNAVDEGLIRWLDDIRKEVVYAIRRYATPAVRARVEMELLDKEDIETAFKDAINSVSYPYVHYFVAQAKNRPVPMGKCAPIDERSICDSLAGLIDRDTGDFEFDSEGVVWNKEAAMSVLLDNRYPMTAVRAAAISKEALQAIGDNWFNRTNTDEDRELFRRIRCGEPVGQKAVLMTLWRNEAAMCHHMEGTNLMDKKAEYRKTVKAILYAQADSIEWTNTSEHSSVPLGYVFSEEEKHAAVANSAIICALELQRRNNVEKKGSFAMFVLGVFQEELLANVKRNGFRNEAFLFDFDMSDMELDAELDLLSDEDELYEDAKPMQQTNGDIEDIPDDFIPENSYIPEENMWFGDDEYIAYPDAM